MNKVDKDTLYEMYVIRGKPMHEVANDLDISTGTVYYYLKKYGIKIRTKSEAFSSLKAKGWKYPESAKETTRKKNTGRVFSEETKKKMSESKKMGGIGHKKKRTDGYIYVYFPDHPKSTKGGYIMEHDLIMECLIGRHLKDNEVVHHINSNRSDNRKENLKLMTFEEHCRYHMKKRYEEREGEILNE